MWKTLEFHVPESGGWTVVKDKDTGEIIYSGHERAGNLSLDILQYLGVEHKVIEYDDLSFEYEF